MEERVRLVVLFGGQSAEHDVSCISARHVLAAADPGRYAIEPIGITRSGRWLRADDAIACLAAGPDTLPEHLVADGPEVDPLPVLTPNHDADLPTVVFPVLHGPLGEDGTIQGLLELSGVPYVGSGVLGSALCMDKLVAKQVAKANGIPQARYRGLHVDEITPHIATELAEVLGLPVFVKPGNMGSSVGVSKATTVDEIGAAIDIAARFDEWIVVEEAIVGREIEVGVLGNRQPQASVPGEIIPGDEFYSYNDKYLDGASEERIPADLPDHVLEEIRSLAIKAYSAMRCDGLARVDFFYEADRRGPLLNEVNTMPGFTPISMYPKLWAATGVSYRELIDHLVDLALARHERRSAHHDTQR